MPDKQLTIATYAAGASLAAITLVYVFAPTFFIDGESASTSASSRKKTIVGLSNPANDCFINSVLQALAGLGDLRIYLIRETHRRKLDGRSVYSEAVADPARKNLPAWKLEGLQHGIVTHGLKDVLDALNERPIYKKTISAAQFVQVLETAFKQRISRQQQDAQEFLQVVAERLCDEYHAGHRARNHARQNLIKVNKIDDLDEVVLEEQLENVGLENGNAAIPTFAGPELLQNGNSNTSEERLKEETEDDKNTSLEREEGFPLEGGSESQIECLSCGFKPRPTTSTFCSLTLSVPQVSSTTLSSCFDQMFKTEYIDDFKCEKCRLVHALELLQQELSISNSDKFKTKAKEAIMKLEDAIASNPEADLSDVELPDRKFAPKRRIAKHVRVTQFPKVMAIHLSRSIFDAGRTTMKNSAKVAFPERLPLGGLLNQRFYRLSSVVCHKGSHHSGHYETFRRQAVVAPFATPNTFQIAHVYSKPTTPIPSQISTPRSEPLVHLETNGDTSTLSLTPEVLSPTSAASSSPSLPYTNGTGRTGESARDVRSLSASTTSTDTATTARGPSSASRDNSDTNSIRSVARSARDSLTSKIPDSMKRKGSKSSTSTESKKKEMSETPTSTTFSSADAARGKKRPNKSNRWWRISDDKIKESKTSDVLSMQREVYLLFYELERDE
jgi:ubiquitin carboxyl-terminal hydrolase 16